MPTVLHVWLPLPVPGLDYLAPHDPPAETEASEDAVGRRLAVPWQGGLRVGWVAAARSVPAAEALDLRPAVAWVPGPLRLGAAPRAMLWAQSERCVVPIGVAVAAGGPPGLRSPWAHEVRRDPGTPIELLGAPGAALADAGWHDGAAFDAERLDEWRRHGLVQERVAEAPDLRRRLVALREADAALGGAARAAQRAALGWLEAMGTADGAAALARDADVPVSAARALIAKGYAGYAELPRPPAGVPWAAPAPQAGPVLTPDDRWAGVERLLLTGGDARARWAAAVGWLAPALAEGAQALLLVPEQATAEALAVASAASWPTLRWGGDLPDDARAAAAATLAEGASALVIGTYPALSLALPRLRRVLVWDAASSSLKQVAGARSVARQDALELARAAGAAWALLDPLATAELQATRHDVAAVLPRVAPRGALLDLRSEPGWPLTASLVRLLRQVAERERQAVVVSGRRGYAAALGCRACGEVVMCPNCDLPLRWHQRAGRLRCHHCGTESGAPAVCPSCGGPAPAPRPGAGTEWVAEAVRGVLPGTPVWTWDRDHRDDPAPLLAGESGVLVGTLAVLRLPPLPRLSLIALAAGDALHDHEDLRAEEASLRTLLSLGDLAAPGRRPLLVAQVHRPEHDVWTTWLADDPDTAADAFAQRVSARRRALGYPPARRWARVQVTHRDPRAAAGAAKALVATLRTAGVPADDVLGPAPAPLARARGKYAFHVFVRADDDATLATRVAAVDPRPGGGVQVRCDVDPYDVETWLEV